MHFNCRHLSKHWRTPHITTTRDRRKFSANEYKNQKEDAVTWCQLPEAQPCSYTNRLSKWSRLLFLSAGHWLSEKNYLWTQAPKLNTFTDRIMNLQVLIRFMASTVLDFTRKSSVLCKTSSHVMIMWLIFFTFTGHQSDQSEDPRSAAPSQSRLQSGKHCFCGPHGRCLPADHLLIQSVGDCWMNKVSE